ncbi:MAG TPA: DUF5980 family protein [Candidatus Limnocylindrales bacterium]|nr:DUF5980 family protein [Candidatus Limnocylindrales bacterium]
MRPRRATALLAVSIFLLALFGGAPAHAASPAPTTASWQLIDNQQKTCYVTTRGGTNYYGVWISGTWTHRITIGADALPAGGSYFTSYAPIPPGTSDGIGSLAYAAVVLPVGTPVGTYTASLWASDATVTQTVPITLVVNATSCRNY